MSTKKEKLKNIKEELDRQCLDNFNEDYQKKVWKLINALEKNNDFSMDSGKEEGWVSAILYIVGEDSSLFNENNYLNDKEYYTKTQLANYCNISVSTMKSRAQEIRKYLPSNLSFKADISIFNRTIIKNIIESMSPEEEECFAENLERLLLEIENTELNIM